MLPGIDLAKFLADIGWLVYLIVPAMLFAETGFLIGFFLPGDSVLFTAGALAGLGVINVNIWLMAGIFFVAAVLGNSVGYEIGKRFGRKLFEYFAKKEEHRRNLGSKIFKKKYLVDSQKFYDEKGHSAVILAQFMPIIRTFNPVVAGISEMKYSKFITFNMIGAALWAAGITLLGYFGFTAITKVIPGFTPEKIDSILLPIIVLIVIISLIPVFIHGLQAKKSKNAKKTFEKSKEEK